jgi:transmembrane sensor
MSATLPTDAQQPLVRRDANLTASLAWVKGTLVFENTPVADFLDEIGRWYGVQIELRDSASQPGRITGRFLLSESSEQVMQSVANLLGARATRRGSAIVLTPR